MLRIDTHDRLIGNQDIHVRSIHVAHSGIDSSPSMAREMSKPMSRSPLNISIALRIRRSFQSFLGKSEFGSHTLFFRALHFNGTRTHRVFRPGAQHARHTALRKEKGKKEKKVQDTYQTADVKKKVFAQAGITNFDHDRDFHRLWKTALP